MADILIRHVHKPWREAFRSFFIWVELLHMQQGVCLYGSRPTYALSRLVCSHASSSVNTCKGTQVLYAK